MRERSVFVWEIILRNHQNAFKFFCISNFIKSNEKVKQINIFKKQSATHWYIHAFNYSLLQCVLGRFSHILILISVQTSVPSMQSTVTFSIALFFQTSVAFAAEFPQNTRFMHIKMFMINFAVSREFSQALKKFFFLSFLLKKP